MMMSNLKIKELVRLDTILGYINSHMMLCHQLVEGEAKVPAPKLDGIHQIKPQIHQLMDHMEVIQLILQLGLLLNTDTTTIIITKLKTLEMKESLRKFMDLLQMINLFSHNHGEEPR